jgi:hypothetical protein
MIAFLLGFITGFLLLPIIGLYWVVYFARHDDEL